MIPSGGPSTFYFFSDLIRRLPHRRLLLSNLLLSLMALSACGGRIPNDLGITEGRLSACPPSPNCVSSQADSSDARHYVEPFPFVGSADSSRARLLDILERMPRTRVEQDEPAYLHVTFRSTVLRFIDDVELLVDDSARVIHVRSASRVGRGDFGVNRRRVEEIRRRFVAPRRP